MKENSDPAAAGHRPIGLRVIGVGGAGLHLVEHLEQSGLEGVGLLGAHTDERRLREARVTEKLLLGAKNTRGLGAAGDPECGREAAEQETERLRAFCAAADLVFVIAGLGRGTGSGAAPVVARVARESGALALGVATLPFEFEGARRQRQAHVALRQFQAQADAVLCLPNQQVFQLVPEHTLVPEAFRLLNGLATEGVRGLWRMLTRPGLLDVNFGELCAVMRGRHAEGRFAAVEAEGGDRARVAVEKLLVHPLLDGGAALSGAEGLLVSVSGGPDLTMKEVNLLLQQLNAQCQNARLVAGVAVEENFGDRLALTVVTSRPARQATDDDSMAGEPASAHRPLTDQPAGSPDFETEFFHARPAPRPAPRFVPPAPDLPPAKKQALLAHQRRLGRRSGADGPRLKQTLLPLEIVHKGRFAKSEPTICHGEDLDVPTYIRRGVALN